MDMSEVQNCDNSYYYTTVTNLQILFTYNFLFGNFPAEVI
jgi:hypothetical protein